MEIIICFTGVAFFWSGVLLFLAALESMPDYEIKGNKGKRLNVFYRLYCGFKYIFCEVK